MGILGQPDAELVELLGVIDEIQQRVRRRSGTAPRGPRSSCGRELVEASPHRGYLEFVAHGMGLVSHEAPRPDEHGSRALSGL